ncbi:MAG: Ig-like domain-containing protein [Nitrospirae bacterium]|nr:Ig-like domain-containing protein [Nitrospirota bacterium]
MGLALMTVMGMPLAAWADTEPPTIIMLAQPLHFQASDGSDVVAEAGEYEVKPLVGSRLQLRATGKESVFVQAVVTQHEEAIEAATGLVVIDEQNPDLVHVVLLQPEGRGLDAVGSLSGVQIRGAAPQPVSAAQLKAARDTVPPSGYVTTPKGGSAIKGTVLIDVKATDNRGIQNVQILVDGSPAFCSLEKNAPYTCNWDTRKVKDGSHALSATIRDTAHNMVTTAQIAVMVQNLSATQTPQVGTQPAVVLPIPSVPGTGPPGTFLQMKVNGAKCVSGNECQSGQCYPYPDRENYCIAKGLNCAFPNTNGVGWNATTSTYIERGNYTCTPGLGWARQSCPTMEFRTQNQCTNLYHDAKPGTFTLDDASFCRLPDSKFPISTGAGEMRDCSNQGFNPSTVAIECIASYFLGVPILCGAAVAIPGADCQIQREAEKQAARIFEIELDKSARIARAADAKPIPSHIKSVLSCFFDPGILEGVYYTTKIDAEGAAKTQRGIVQGAVAGSGGNPLNIPGAIVGGLIGGLTTDSGWMDIALTDNPLSNTFGYRGQAAITLNPDIIAFQSAKEAEDNYLLWAHEPYFPHFEVMISAPV